MRGRYEDLTGKRFGRLVVQERSGSSKCHVPVYRCRCDCGNETRSLANSLRTGGARSCGCLNRERVRVKNTKAFGEAAFNNILYVYRKQAHARGLNFLLTRDEFRALVVSECHYCGTSPRNVMKATGGNFTYNGIDRTNNSEGYRLGNVVSCCRTCNIAKGTMSVAEFFSWVNRVHQRRES